MWKKVSVFGDKIIKRVDEAPLFWMGFVLFAIVFIPFMILQGGSVFEIHDQMDESMMNYVLTARHLGENTIPELLNGIMASGMQPSAFLMVPLYRVAPPVLSFISQYAICFLAGFFGMYFCVRELTKSNIWAFVIAGCFVMLPMYPVYGFSQYGIPLLLYAWMCLFGKKNIKCSFAIVLLFAGMSHLVYTGYVVLAFWLLSLLVLTLTGKRNRYLEIGFVVLLIAYMVLNYRLFAEILFGAGSYVSHREEMVNYAQSFWPVFKDVFVNSAQHAPSYHRYLILPIVVSLLAGGIFYKRFGAKRKNLYWISLGGIITLIAIALFYAVCKTGFVVNLKNSVGGFLHYFQMERFYWIYPAGWYLEAALCIGLWWNASVEGEDRPAAKYLLWKAIVIGMILLPTVSLIKEQSIFYLNVNQINNGSGITGYVTWDAYYAEDLMKEIENVIGRDMSSYRIAHLGISPAPALMHGFYTVDGYSNNYPLDYKHCFREVIDKELEKNEQTRLYFDEWGNRCYLFNGTTGTYWNLAKGNNIQYQDLEFDMQKLAELGCEYLFSGAEITDFEEMGLEYMGYYETEESYWGIWLYKLK